MKHLILLSLTCVCTLAVAGVGDLDPSFDGDGVRQIAFDISPSGSGFDQGYTLLLQDDGRIVIGGAAEKEIVDGSNRDFGIARVNPDGSIDSSFGQAGYLTVAFDLGGFSDSIRGMAAYPGGRIVVAGIANDFDGIGGVGAWAVARLSANGSLDTSFDLDGKVDFSIVPTTATEGSALLDVAVQDDGKILLAGYFGEEGPGGTFSRGVVVRLDADGSMDTTFGTAGRVEFDAFVGDPLFTLAQGIESLPNGDILVIGSANTASGGAINFDMFATRLDSDGDLDTDFGSGGTQIVSFDQGGGDQDVARDLAIDSQGRIVLGGSLSTTTDVDMAVARLLSDGTPDPGFGTSGRAVFGFDLGGDLEDSAFGVAVDADDRVYLTGNVDRVEGTDIGVLRATTDGQPDAGFGTAGRTVVAIDNAPAPFNGDFAEAIEIDSRGRAVVAGFAELQSPNGNYDMVLIRLTGDQLFRDRFEASP